MKYEMSEYQVGLVLRTVYENKVYGTSLEVNANYLEGDKRKQKKRLRELEQAGVIEQAGESWRVTTKLWDELPCEAIDLFAIWEASRKGWNERKDLPLVRVNALSWGQKKTLLLCAGHYDWALHYASPLVYATMPQLGDHIPIANPEGDLPSSVRVSTEFVEACVKGRGNRTADVEIVIGRDSLNEYARKKLASEKLEDAYRRNLKWGLVNAGAATEEDAKAFDATGMPSFMTSTPDLGDEPTKWGERLVEAAKQQREKAERALRRADALERIAAGVDSAGGWERFLADYRAALADKIGSSNEV